VFHLRPLRNNDGITDSGGESTQTSFRTKDNAAGMADGVTKRNVSARLGLCRSQPCNNGASLGRQPRPNNAFADRVTLDSKVIPQGYQQSRSASSDRRPMCSPSEYFCLKTSRNDAVPDNRSAGGGVTPLTGCCLNDSNSAATDDLHSCRNPAGKVTEPNLCTGGSSRRSGIPVSSTYYVVVIYWWNLCLCQSGCSVAHCWLVYINTHAE